jgi:hypothetical protein
MAYYCVYAGRAAMVGFFMAYFVDSLTGVGLVDQMGSFFCKTLLFVAYCWSGKMRTLTH